MWKSEVWKVNFTCPFSAVKKWTMKCEKVIFLGLRICLPQLLACLKQCQVNADTCWEKATQARLVQCGAGYCSCTLLLASKSSSWEGMAIERGLGRESEQKRKLNCNSSTNESSTCDFIVHFFTAENGYVKFTFHTLLFHISQFAISHVRWSTS